MVRKKNMEKRNEILKSAYHMFCEKGSSIGLAIVIFIGTVNTFLPSGYGMWTTTFAYFNQPWFYITGVVVSEYAFRY